MVVQGQMIFQPVVEKAVWELTAWFTFNVSPDLKNLHKILNAHDVGSQLLLAFHQMCD